jgi:hypothetical protein
MTSQPLLFTRLSTCMHEVCMCMGYTAPICSSLLEHDVPALCITHVSVQRDRTILTAFLLLVTTDVVAQRPIILDHTKLQSCSSKPICLKTTTTRSTKHHTVSAYSLCYHQDRNSRNEADDCTQYPWNSLHQATRHHRMYGMTTTGHRSDLRILSSPNRRSRYDYIKKSGAGFVPHTTSLSSSCFRGQCRVYRPK